MVGSSGQFFDRLGVNLGVLPQVERMQMEAEGLYQPLHRRDIASGQPLPGITAQALPEDIEIMQQRGRIRISFRIVRSGQSQTQAETDEIDQATTELSLRQIGNVFGGKRAGMKAW